MRGPSPNNNNNTLDIREGPPFSAGLRSPHARPSSVATRPTQNKMDGLHLSDATVPIHKFSEARFVAAFVVAATCGGGLLLWWLRRSERHNSEKQVRTDIGSTSNSSGKDDSPRPAAAPPLGMPLDDHVDLESMNVLQFVLHPAAQDLLLTMQKEVPA